jgi:hypothetical protein
MLTMLISRVSGTIWGCWPALGVLRNDRGAAAFALLLLEDGSGV